MQPSIEWPRYIYILQFHNAPSLNIWNRATRICNVYATTNRICRRRERGVQQNRGGSGGALEDHLEFITARRCVNTRRESDKQHPLFRGAMRGVLLLRQRVAYRSVVHRWSAARVALSSRGFVSPPRGTITDARERDGNYCGKLGASSQLPRGLKFNLCRCHRICTGWKVFAVDIAAASATVNLRPGSASHGSDLSNPAAFALVSLCI